MARSRTKPITRAWRAPIQNESGAAYLIMFVVSTVVAGSLLGLMQMTARVNASAHRSLGQLQFNALIEQTNTLLRQMSANPSACTLAFRGEDSGMGNPIERFPTNGSAQNVRLLYPGTNIDFLRNGTQFGNLNVTSVRLLLRQNEGDAFWWSVWLRIQATLTTGQTTFTYSNGQAGGVDGGDSREIPILMSTSQNVGGTRPIKNCTALFFQIGGARVPLPRCAGFQVLHHSQNLGLICITPGCIPPQTRNGWNPATGNATCI